MTFRIRDGLSLGSDVVIDNNANITSKDFYNDAALPVVKPTLNLNFAKTKTLDSRITFTRASTASYTDGYGVMKFAAVNEPRFDHDPVTGESLGLLVEESRSNFIFPSQDFRSIAEGGEWSTSTEGITVVADATTAPDGTLTADKFILSSTINNHARYKTHGGTAINTTYVGSVFVKNAGHNFAFAAFNNTGYGGVGGGILVDLTTGEYSPYGVGANIGVQKCSNGWWRIYFCHTSDSDGGNFIFQIGAAYSLSDITFTGNDVDGIYVWGAQVEVGAFPTSYIPTTTTSVTRASDSPIMSGTNFNSWYRQDEGSMYVEISKIAYPNLAFNWCVYNTATAVTSYEMRTSCNSYGANPNFAVNEPSGTTCAIYVAVPAGTLYKSVASYAQNNFNYCLSGVFGTPDTDVNVQIMNAMAIGHRPNLTCYLNGTIRCLKYYPKRLSNSESQELTK